MQSFINFIYISFIFSIINCISNQHPSPYPDDKIDSLKEVKSFVLGVENLQFQIETNGLVNPDPSELATSSSVEDSISQGFKKVLSNLSSNDVKVIKKSELISLAFISETETVQPNTEIAIKNQHVLKKLKSEKSIHNVGYDAEIKVNSVITLSYTTKFPDLGIFNLLYGIIILDTWWIDMVGEWYLKNELNFSIINSKGEVTHTINHNGYETEKLGTRSSKDLTPAMIESSIQRTSSTFLAKLLKVPPPGENPVELNQGKEQNSEVSKDEDKKEK